jgi:hypothetical protein
MQLLAATVEPVTTHGGVDAVSMFAIELLTKQAEVVIGFPYVM